MKWVQRIAVLLCFFSGTSDLHAQDFEYEDLVQLIRDRDIKSIDELLAHLPTALLENFTFIHNSHSLQYADAGFPRTILFGEDASLIVTFNGKPDSSGYDELEVIQFRAEERAFDFRQITFPSEQSPQDPVRFSRRNPPICLGCHSGADPRPIWDSYPFWRGAYGEQDDFRLGSEGLADFLRFKNGNMTQGRYRHLKVREGSANAPYEDQGGSGGGRLRFRPNFRLMENLLGHNAEREWRLLYEKSNYQTTKFLFLLKYCGNNGVTNPKEKLIEIFGANHLQPIDRLPITKQSNMPYYALQAMNISDDRWLMRFLPRPASELPYGFNSGLPSPNPDDLVWGRIFLELAAEDSYFAQFYQPDTYFPKIFSASEDKELLDAMTGNLQAFDNRYLFEHELFTEMCRKILARMP